MAEMDGPRFGPKAGGAARQLVVLCHGVGADGNDLIDLAPAWAQALPEAAFVAPHAPFAYDMAPFGRQWFSLRDRNPAVLAAGVREAARLLDGFLDSERARFGLAAAKCALMGFSQGAMTALLAGLGRADPPRAILAYSGRLVAPPERVPGAPAPEVLLVHGEADEVVPVANSRAAEKTLAALGVPVEAIFRPRLGHGIDEVGLSSGALFLQRAFSRDTEAKR